MSDDQNSNLVPQLDDEVVLIDFEQVEEVARVFFEESKEILEGLDGLILKLEENPEDMEHINVLFRKVHTLKGSVGAVPGGQLLGSLAHECEALLNRIKRESQAITRECIDIFLNSSRLLRLLAEALREKRELHPEELSETIEIITRYGNFEFTESGKINNSKKTKAQFRSSGADEGDGVWLSMGQLNEMLRLSGELLVLKNFFQMMNQTVNFRTEPDVFERRQNDFSQNLSKISDQFHGHIHLVRKEKASESFQSLPVLVRQAATELNKNIQLEMTGTDLMIDKGLARDLSECLVHLARNSIDHGIEDQFERAVQGKNSIGQLRLEVSEKNGVVGIIFQDDGKGLDKERILDRAIKSGLVTAETSVALSDDEIFQFIFQAGFSTKDKVTTISGRGVGMDIVLSTVEKYGGSIHISSRPNEGAQFKIEMPVPQLIMVESALLCRWNGFQLAVPITSVAHISSCDHLQTTTVDRLRFCQFQGHTVPLLNYREVLDLRTQSENDNLQSSSAIFMKVNDAILALVVDKIESQTDLVIKNFGRIIGEQKGFKGVSILADEKVTYIIDPEQLVALVIKPQAEEEAA